MAAFLYNLSRSYFSKYMEQMCNYSTSDQASSLDSHKTTFNGLNKTGLILTWLLSLAIATFVIFVYQNTLYEQALESIERTFSRRIRQIKLHSNASELILALPKEDREMGRARFIVNMDRANWDVDDEVYKRCTECYLEGGREEELEMLRDQVYLKDGELNKLQRMGFSEFRDYWYSLGVEERGKLREGIESGALDGWSEVKFSELRS